MEIQLVESDGPTQTASNWNIVGVVAELRALRAEWRGATKPDGVLYELPSQKTLSDIVVDLSVALFPRHFGRPGLTEEGVDYAVGNALGRALQLLLEQVRRELRLTAKARDETDEERETRAQRIVREFAARLPKVRALLESDIQAAYRGDPAAHSVDEVLFCYPGVVAVIRHRLAHELYRLEAPLLARIIAEIAHSTTGIDIHPGAQIDESFFIDHGTGVVIGETAVIGKRVRLYQAVTLGAKRFAVDESGALLKGGARHPIIEDDVVIYAGATILGRVTIGHGSTIGGNVWLTRGVPPGSNITQAQTRNDVFVDGGGI
ncbi:serine O-acetyltransferase EpsC [Methylocapsa acidiphila]|uniref:serine O-acetyltransferase EpsC n=1 Tax=Methylocapsa acidiphila TaxID=133552 RepID=UPI00040D052C|nr:serine O-acetyltransferase EpsC [Methylocapsa acidiphila]